MTNVRFNAAGSVLATYYQLRVAKKMGVTVGSEFRGAFQEACAQDVPVVLGTGIQSDPPAHSRPPRLVGKDATVHGGGYSLLRLPSEEEQELLKNPDAVSDMIKKLGKRYPALKIVIDERDRYMVQKSATFLATRARSWSSWALATYQECCAFGTRGTCRR